MRELPQQHLVEVFRKCGGFVTRGIVSGPEFIIKTFDEFADADQVHRDIIPELWAVVPDLIRHEYAVALRNAVLPGFCYHAFFFGGGRARTEDEIRRDAELRTTRVQAWAAELVRWLDDSCPNPPSSPTNPSNIPGD
jgi:hypothetical protein